VSSTDGQFDAAIRAHDQAVAACKLQIWVGAEPTFTNRQSESPEWLSEALGDSKQAYACAMVEHLQRHYPQLLVLRSVGRQYPGESRPRWSMGLYRYRDGRALCAGLPRDPLSRPAACEDTQLEAFWRALGVALDRHGWVAAAFRCDGELGLRLVFRTDGDQPVVDPVQDPRLARGPLDSTVLPASGIVDELAEIGSHLVAIGCAPTGPGDTLQACIELPALPDVATFMTFLQCVAAAAGEAGLGHLVWRGFPPPVDADTAWATLTPDPAVLEVNAAPARDLSEFLTISRQWYATAEAVGLSPYRLQYNGEIGESGGGGQFTLGGPSPLASPFFLAPQLLGQLVGYFNRHPALSYWFAPDYLGSFSQSPRTDENVRESFSELQVVLQHLAANPAPTPEFIWRSLSPFLVDASGNSHRSEINIEKLWNTSLPSRGCLGLVEFRAFRMAPDAESAAAIAALLRAIAAMLSGRNGQEPLLEWGSRLHDQFALPFYLRRDLQAVFSDLAAADLALGEPIAERLLSSSWRIVGSTEFAGCRLDVERGIEFWPLLGDAALQAGGSRLVDASTARLQITLRAADAAAADALGDWQLHVAGVRIPLRDEVDEAGKVRLTGLRYRAFEPWIGLHPGIGKQAPVVLLLCRPGLDSAIRITLHDWQPQGEAYDGLPQNLQEARRRIAERFVVEILPAADIPAPRTPPPEALSDYCLDLRRT
jgi:uncharacterized protein (DUF2126 family)